MRPLVEAIGLHRRYKLPGGRVLRALDGIDLAIEAGDTVGLVGESGSGKSTLGRTLVGLQTASEGTVRFAGTDVDGARGTALAMLRRQRQFVFQDPSAALNPRMTVATTLSEHMAALGVRRSDRRARTGSALALAGLDAAFAGRYPHELSGGQRQRAVIARALSTEPDFVVADEPVSALDVSTRAQIVNLLAELQRARHLTMLFISHDLSIVAHLCRRVAVMYLGRLVEVGTRDALFAAPLHPYTHALMSAVPVPDPLRERTRRRIVLEGETPDAAAIPSGCRFHPRCGRATSVCREVDPALVVAADQHLVACHHPGPVG